MTISKNLLDLLACPVSGNPLSIADKELTDQESGSTYPIIDGIPWLLPNPQNSLLDWSVKLNHFHQVLHSEIGQLETAIDATTGLTQERLQKLHAGKISFTRTVFELLTPIVRNPMAGKAVYDALNDIAPNTQNLLSYEANLYRDWVWGQEENDLCRDIVYQHIDASRCEKILVLGAGAGRLAWDIHQSIKPDMTVTTDINPLLVLAAQQIMKGKGLTIHEFPEQPILSEHVAIEHHIKGLTVADNFHSVFSDANKPSFQKGSFDTLITPWFIDIQPLEFSRFLKQLNQYISIGDQWINFGSLVFNQQRDAFCYSIDEVKAIAKEQGFEIEAISQQQIPYLKSPYNAGHRIENIWSWSARKTKDVDSITDTQVLPEWLRDMKKAIPKTDDFKEFSARHRLYAQLGAEVDGRTSIQKISNKLAKQRNIDKDEASKLVRNLFIDLIRVR
ncbi:MAG: class I SAM-dependent methyltransferase [Cellvibrionaceae bacterium]